MHLFPESLELTPGEPAALQVDIYNDRDVIDSFVVSLLGLGAETLSVQPPELSLFPSSEGSVTIVFTPSVDLAAGKRSAGVKVSSTTDVSLSQVEPLPIDVAELTAVSLDVEPQTISGGRRAHFGLVVENRGNTKASVRLTGIDPERALEFTMSPPRLDVAPGARKVARAVASGKRPFMGTPVARVITFQADGDGGRQEAMATFIQRPLVSRGVLTFLGLLAVVAVWALALFAGFSKLLSHQDAKNASVAKAATAAAEAAAAANKGAGAGGSGGAGGANGGAGGTGAGGSGQITGTVMGPAVTIAALSGQPRPPELAGPSSAGGQAGSSGVAGAVIEAHPSANPAQLASAAVADSSGTFTITGLVPGTYKLRANAQGYQSLWYPAAALPDQAMTVTVPAGGAAPPVAFMLSGLPGSVSGTIQSVSGPVSAAQVSVNGGSKPTSVMSGADGSFRLAGLTTPGDYQLTIAKAGFPAATVSLSLAAGEQLTDQQLLLSSDAGTISGTVSDDLGVPIGGAKVVVNDVAGRLVNSTTTMVSGTVGFFIVSGLATPAADTVVISAIGYQPFTKQVSLTAGSAAIDLSSQLIPLPLSISGTVSRAATAGAACPCGLAGASATAGGKGANGAATTAADGSYSITNLRPGQYTVTYSSPGYTVTSVTVTLTPGQNGTQKVTLTAPPSHILGALGCAGLLGTKEAVHTSLTTLAGAAVPGVPTLTFQSPGPFDIPGIPGLGKYQLTFKFDSGAKAQEQVEVLAGQNVTVPGPPCTGGTVGAPS